MTDWDLPRNVAITGVEYAVQTDYRDILDIIARLQSEDEPENIRLYVAINLFYVDFASIPRTAWQTAVEKMMWFIACGHPDAPDSRPIRPLLDWDQDRSIIVADINKVAGCEIRALPYLHWWTFISYFGAVGEGQLSMVVTIRDKRARGKKLEAWEREYYSQNRDRVDIKPHYTAAELAEQERLKKLLDT